MLRFSLSYPGSQAKTQRVQAPSCLQRGLEQDSCRCLLESFQWDKVRSPGKGGSPRLPDWILWSSNFRARGLPSHSLAKPSQFDGHLTASDKGSVTHNPEREPPKERANSETAQQSLRVHVKPHAGARPAHKVLLRRTLAGTLNAKQSDPCWHGGCASDCIQQMKPRIGGFSQPLLAWLRLW